MSFTILDNTLGKESATPGRPLMLAVVTAKDGHVTRLTTAAASGGSTLVYGGDTYKCRISNANIDQIQAVSPQGYDIVPSFGLELQDSDASLYTNDITPHGWRGAELRVVFIMWDVPSGTFSDDSFQWKFILGKPGVADSNGTLKLTVDSTSKMNMGRIKVPSVPISRRSPWVFPGSTVTDPTGVAARIAGLSDRTSIYFQCGYSPDQLGGVGNYETGTTPFLTCDYTRQSCIARGMFSVDSSSRPTGRFGGITWIPPVQFSGKQYTSGNKIYGFNQPITAIFNECWNFLYGTQWVDATVVNTAAEPNSLRGEAVVCVAANGPANVVKLVVNGVEIPYNGSDVLFTWRYVNQGGRNGHVNGDAIYDGQGDPYGSLCCIEFVVPTQLASGGAPQVQALAQGPPVATFLDNGDGTFAVSYEQSTNPIWHLIDLLTWGNWSYNITDVTLADIDLASFCVAAAVCDTSISYLNLTGASATHERFRSSFALKGSQRQALSQVVTALRNSANIMLGPNSATGLLSCFIRQTLADQQPAAIAGSNYNTAVSSKTADGTTADGYLAYLFSDNGSIIKGSFKTVPRPIADTPNRVSFAFQDEDNVWVQDSLSQVDPDAYVSSGNTPIDVPLQVNAIPNFDQATRISNVQLSEALRGNARDDADGTEYFEFRASVGAVHLVSLMGAICGLEWQQLGF